MEEDKKKKKNRKKKNKQATKSTESVTLDVVESTSDSQKHVLEIGQDNNGQVSGIIHEPDDVQGHVHANSDGHLANGFEGASYQEKIKELQAERDAHIQKKAIMEERIQQLLKEKDENSQKEAIAKETIKQLHDEKNASIQNEASLKEKLVQLEKESDAIILKQDLEQQVQQLQMEIDSHLQKEASLETEVLQLNHEKDSWFQKEAGFVEKINQLVDEAAILSLKEGSLQEKIKQMERERDTWILKENSAKESIASLINDNTNLRAQVIELEQSRGSLLVEKQQLTEIISSLELKINNLESTAGFPHSSTDDKVTQTSPDGELNYQLEAARTLVAKLVADNSELVEKVNELYTELDRRGAKEEHLSSVTSLPVAQSVDMADGSALTPDFAVGADDRHSVARATDSISKASNTMPISISTQSLEDVMVKDERNGELVHVNDGPGLANSSEIVEADEIEQIPLHENGVKEPDLVVAQDDDESDVGITDAPLIGAPFRLISFFARYVSGADLVRAPENMVVGPTSGKEMGPKQEH